MYLETIFTGESVTTLLALKGLFSAVRQQMALEITGVLKQLSAFLALVTLCRRCHDAPKT